jgi:hypothetical protein
MFRSYVVPSAMKSLRVCVSSASTPLLASSCRLQRQRFTDEVRARDGRCCFTGTGVPPALRGGYNYSQFEAARIFPLSETEQASHHHLPPNANIKMTSTSSTHPG